MAKQTKTNRAKNPKPESAPDKLVARVLFNTGASIELDFDDPSKLLTFKSGFEKSTGKHEIAQYYIGFFQPTSGGIATQQIVINWDTVVAVNFSV